MVNFSTIKIARVAATIPVYPLMPDKQRYAAWLRRELEHAGCLYVKIGQWVSSRTDLFPNVVTDELAALRTSSDPMPSRAVHDAIAGFDFEAFEERPVSTGSIAQVHRAVFRGAQVAVKIQRPRLLPKLKGDVRAIKRVFGIARWTNAKMYDDLVTSLDDLIDTVTRELDFQAEAAHMKRFHAFFEHSDFVIPRVIVSTPNVIVMEFIDSQPFCGSVTKLMDLFFRQFFQLGYLHTDMHAGNIAQTSDGTPVLFDFGSVLEIPDDIRLCIKCLMVSYLNKNVSVMLDYMLEYGMLVGTPSDAERAMLEAFLHNVIEYVEVTDMSRFTKALKTIPVSYDVTPSTSFRPEVFMIMRSFTLLEGLCKSLDPNFVILDAVQPLTDALAADPLMIRLKIEDDLRTVFRNLS